MTTTTTSTLACKTCGDTAVYWRQSAAGRWYLARVKTWRGESVVRQYRTSVPHRCRPVTPSTCMAVECNEPPTMALPHPDHCQNHSNVLDRAEALEAIR